MSRQFSFHTTAEQELNEAAAYYEAESRGLGTAFLRAVEHAVQRILEYPESAPLVNRLVRSKLVRRFPHSVMYSVTPKVFGYLRSRIRNAVTSIGAIANESGCSILRRPTQRAPDRLKNGVGFPGVDTG